MSERLLSCGAIIGGVLWAACAWGCGLAQASVVDDVAYQLPLRAMEAGEYDGTRALADLLDVGDHGLGTIDHADGELIVVDGQPWRAGVDLQLNKVDPKTSTPFAVVKRFRADRTVTLGKITDHEQLAAQLTATLEDPHALHALRIDGSFSRLQIRSVPKQPAEQGAPEQVTRDLTDVKGTMIGFYSPPHLGEVNVRGVHFHFVNADRTVGGHVLDMAADSPVVRLDRASGLVVLFPQRR